MKYNVVKIRWLLYGVIALTVLVSFAMVWRMIISVPIKHIYVNADLQYVQQSSLDNLRHTILSKGFFSLNIHQIQVQLENDVWIDRVDIKRRWPNVIDVRITEQVPMARWQNGNILTRRGDVLISTTHIVDDTLPLLQGPSDERLSLATMYHNFDTLLQKQGLRIRRLSTSNSGGIEIDLHRVLSVDDAESTVAVVLDGHQATTSLQMFIRAYQSVLSSVFNCITRVDMRYSNGFSVAWIE